MQLGLKKIKFTKGAVFALLFFVLAFSFYFLYSLELKNNFAGAQLGSPDWGCVADQCVLFIGGTGECAGEGDPTCSEPVGYGCNNAGACVEIPGGTGSCLTGGNPDPSKCQSLQCNKDNQCAMANVPGGPGCQIGKTECEEGGCRNPGKCCGDAECTIKKYCDGDWAIEAAGECINGTCEYPDSTALNDPNLYGSNLLSSILGLGSSYVTAAGSIISKQNCNPSGGTGFPAGAARCGVANNGQAVLQDYTDCPQCKAGDCITGSATVIMQPCPLASHQVIDQGCMTPPGGIACYGSHCIWDVTAPGSCTIQPITGMAACDVVTIDIKCSACCSCVSCEGIPPAPLQCNSDGQCVASGGGASCGSPADCNQPFKCNTGTKECVPGGDGDPCDPANEDADCAEPSYVCDTSGKCIIGAGGTPCAPENDGSECVGSAKCSTQTHQCVAGGDGKNCSSDIDCAASCNTSGQCVINSSTTKTDARETVGLYRQGDSKFLLKNSNTSGPADKNFDMPAGYGGKPLSGDWNGDGTATVGSYVQSTSTFYLTNSNSGALSDIPAFKYGSGALTIARYWLPIAGDWNGDGTVTVGLYNPTTYTFFLKNTNITGFEDVQFLFKPATGNLLPVAGDWDGDGIDTVGLYNPATLYFYLRNSNSAGITDVGFEFSPTGGGYMFPVAGDWNNDGRDTLGLYNPLAYTFYTRNFNTINAPTSSFVINEASSYGTNLMPVAGDWDALNGTLPPGSCTSYLDCGYKCLGTQCLPKVNGGTGPDCAKENNGGECIFMCGGTNGTQCVQGVAGAQFHLTNYISTLNFAYGDYDNNWIPLAGDWDGICKPKDGGACDRDTIGLFNPSSSAFYLKNSNATGYSDVTVGFGTPGLGQIPIIGDWDGNGTDTIGLYDPVNSHFYLRNENSTGYSDYTVPYGPPGGGYYPIIGDWNGDGKSGIGLYDPATSTFYLEDFLPVAPFYDYYTFAWGAPGLLPIAGNWDSDSADEVGLYNPQTSAFLYTYDNAAGSTIHQRIYGTPGWQPIAGDWDNDGIDTFGLYDRGQKCGLSDNNSTCNWKCDYTKHQCALGGTGADCDDNADCLTRCGGTNMEQCVNGGTGKPCQDPADCEWRCGALTETLPLQETCAQGATGKKCSGTGDNTCEWSCNTSTQQCVQGGNPTYDCDPTKTDPNADCAFTCGCPVQSCNLNSECPSNSCNLSTHKCNCTDVQLLTCSSTGNGTDKCNIALGNTNCSYKCVYSGGGAQCSQGVPGAGEAACAPSKIGSDCPWHCSGEQCVAGPVPTGGKSCNLSNADPDPDSAGKNLDCENRCAAESTQSASPYPPPRGHLYYDYSCQQGVTMSTLCPNGHADCPSGACNMVTKKCYGSKCADDSNCQYACDTVGGSGTGLHCVPEGGGDACVDSNAYCSHLVCNTDTWTCELKPASTPTTPGYSCTGSFEGGCCPGASDISQCGGCGASCAYNGYWNPCAISNIFYADPPNTPYCSTEGAICYSGSLRGTCTDHYCDVGCVCYPWGINNTCGSNDTFAYPPVFYPLLKPGTELPYYLQGYATCDRCIDPPVATALSASIDCGYVYGQMANTFEWYYYAADSYPESGFEFEVYDSGADFSDPPENPLVNHRVLVYETNFTTPLDPNEQGLVYNSAPIPSTYGASAMGCNQKIEIDNGRSCYLNFGESYYWRVRVTKKISSTEEKTSKWSYFASEGVCSVPSLTLTSPSPGAKWYWNKPATVTWTTSYSVPPTLTIDIIDGTTIRYSVPGVSTSSLSHTFTVPDTIPQSSYYVVRIMAGTSLSDADGYVYIGACTPVWNPGPWGLCTCSGGTCTATRTLTDSVCGFLPQTQTQPCSLSLNAPNGGETWTIGESRGISWSQMYVSGNITISLCAPATSCSTIASNIPVCTGTPCPESSGKIYYWTVGSLASGATASAGNNYYIKIKQGTNGPEDISAAVFTVSSCPVNYYPSGVCNVYCLASDTCHGNGTCKSDGTCECDIEWAGSDCTFCSANYYPAGVCNVYCNPATTCSGNGTCTASGTCSCAAGWSGANCSVCDSAITCSGHGTCTASGCVCDPDYYSNNCSVHCTRSDNCSGHGNCTSTGTGCTCDTNYYGGNCSIYCTRSSYCNNHGDCTASGFCQCDPHYGGTHCNACSTNYYNYPSCNIYCTSSSTCNNHGTCNSSGGCACYADATHGYWAGTACTVCATGYYGPSCTCNNATTCGGHGTCTTSGTPPCNCNTNWFGANCGTYCYAPTTCNGHGSCVFMGSNIYCECNSGWWLPGYPSGTSGSFCNIPCTNATTCNGHGNCILCGGPMPCCQCSLGWYPSGVLTGTGDSFCWHQ